MEKDNYLNNSYNHSINLNERKNFSMTGVKKIENFDDEEFLLDTLMGHLLIKGENLELLKMDSLAGNVSIKGLITSLAYIDDVKKKKDENSIISRLFKWV